METHRFSYKASNGRSRFTFDLCRLRSGWRIYIRRQPSYGRRPATAHISHRLTDDHGRFVCWRGALKTKAEAEAVARLWAEKTVEYIATGTTF